MCRLKPNGGERVRLGVQLLGAGEPAVGVIAFAKQLFVLRAPGNG